MSKKDKALISETEAVLDRTIEDDLEKAKNKIHFGRAKKLNKVREEKSYREHGETFAEYIKKEKWLVS